ncbi:sodium-dependent bicarbonate transport family permease [Pseudotamlana carrageenivorans]|uniref:Sodium-dependent bicarbonate transport family permease n=1 Tax=Pseudotamlana carrageenivorans TaxID=2069432 RepID=A0A2I7SFE0_9FLAO|nr:sodium-dependent bicarbonate transport family permease [Tamlana carrageenivorans]AUS04608.1 sodium-dependent bicarbonate transport family permease [Tamlana carrageenivorans]
MDLHLLFDNLTNPALLFFFLGIIAVQLKSDLSIPENSSKFISLYLLLAIGFKGGQELAHSDFSMEILWSLLFGISLAIIVPFYTYFILRRKFSTQNSGAIAAAYGSVSAVTFVTTISFLELEQLSFSGHMVAVMALMEAPSIMIGLFLMTIFKKQKQNEDTIPMKKVIHHALTNGSVLIIIGSLVIGFMASEEQAQGIKPFTTDIFEGFLAVFLLDMGITSGKKLSDFIKKGWFALNFAIVIPVINGCLVALISSAITENIGNRLLFAILAASASYIAVPAAMKIAAPKANPSLYIPMALAITFPFNITLGMPLYLYIINIT